MLPNEVEMLLPDEKWLVEKPEISIVIPSLNEEITISEFVAWCWQGLDAAGVSGEVIIVDSSSDRTPQLALDAGAKVLRVPKKGLGQAYLDSIPFIQGDFVILGDCDLTYDFRELRPFIDSYRNGNEFVMGSRFRGSIEPGAMPKLHQYFGTPFTTWILNAIYKSSFTDIHCGMRGLTLAALKKMRLTSTGWEYASEMVLKSVRNSMTIDEVPVKFYKDRDGRLSHHRRSGFLSPWIAGWINLKVMLVFSPDSFLLKPGLILTAIGIALNIISLPGTVRFGELGLGTNSAVLGTILSNFGLSLFQTGVFARIIHGFRGGFERKILEKFSYNAGSLLALIFAVFGAGALVIFLLNYLEAGFQVGEASSWATLGFTLLTWAAQVFAFALVLELLRRSNVGKK